MHKYLIIILIIFLFSCGGDEVVNPPSVINFYTDDQQFIDELVSINDSIEDASYIIDRITTDFVDSADSQYYRINKLNLSNMGLDSISNTISNLDSLKILYLNNNQLVNLPSSICDINNQLDSLNVEDNLLCNPQVPTCIISLEPTMTAFFSSQKECDYQMSVEDRDFINDMISSNWGISENDLEYDSLWAVLNHEDNTKWQEFIEYDELNQKDHVVSRIVQIKYEDFNEEGKSIQIIPSTIEEVDSLKFAYLSNNILDEIPAEFGNLIRLKYLHLDKNQIRSIPESIGGSGSQGLKKLERLILNDNQIDSVSAYLGNLTSLTELDLSRNSLETLPYSLCGFSNIIKIVGNQFGCGCVEYESCFSDLIIDQSCEACGN